MCWDYHTLTQTQFLIQSHFNPIGKRPSVDTNVACMLSSLKAGFHFLIAVALPARAERALKICYNRPITEPVRKEQPVPLASWWPWLNFDETSEEENKLIFNKYRADTLVFWNNTIVTTWIIFGLYYVDRVSRISHTADEETKQQEHDRWCGLQF
jgi:hypothetical protein